MDFKRRNVTDITLSTIQNFTEKSVCVPHRYMFFYMLPYLPEIALSAFDFMAFAKMLRRKKPKDISPVTDEDIEAYKYTFSQPGE
jgi:hypothetical protein